NFRITGFTHDPEDAELRSLAQDRSILWIDDWGSGSLLQPGDFGLLAEPTVADRVRAGCDLVCFSGDKLLGGPQAGLIVGRDGLIRRLRRYPLLRALRVDKLVIAAMEATLLSYLCGRAVEEIPVWQMIAAPAAALEARAQGLVAALAQRGHHAEVVPCQSAVGGGSTPGETLASAGVALLTDAPDRLHAALRGGTPPVIGRIADRRLLLDMRTILPEEDAFLRELIAAAYERAGTGQPAQT
ncbi:MAG TPA: L-seryl-tRNA(Sec) selenium transferase, partial [Herpetosiphonaceae bacterium]|nr:L-seryl-tRNA(Sec) selenium transferase [Herpetosiphonaceae bacterium]